MPAAKQHSGFTAANENKSNFILLSDRFANLYAMHKNRETALLEAARNGHAGKKKTALKGHGDYHGAQSLDRAIQKTTENQLCRYAQLPSLNIKVDVNTIRIDRR